MASTAALAWLTDSSALSALGRAIVVTDLDGIIHFWNAKASEVFGWDAAQTLGKSILEVVHLDLEKRSIEELRQAILRGEQREGEWPVQRADGRTIFSHFVSSPMRDAQGNVVGIVSLSEDVTEQRETREQLHDALAVLTGFFEQAPIGIGFWDREFRFQRLNDTLAELNGIPRDEHIGRSIAELLPLVWPDVEDDVRRVVEQGVVFRDREVSGETPRAPGERGYWSETWFPVRRVSGEIIGMGALAVETTEARRAQQSLRESERLYRKTFDNVLAGIAHVDLTGRLLRGNRRLAEIFGYSPDEELDLRFDDVVHPDDLETGVADFLCLLRGECESYTSEIRYLRRDGSPFWARLTATLQRTDDGEAEYAIGIVEDIDTERWTLDALRQSEERYRRTFENASVGMSHIDPEGRFLRVNPKLCEILGRTKEELLGVHFADITHPDDLERNVEAFRQMVSGEVESFAIEKRYLLKDGSVVWARVASGGLEHDRDGKPLHATIIVEDITARRDAEEQMAMAGQVKDEFLGLISHEVRTPLTVVLGLARYLATQPTITEAERDTVADILQYTERLHTVIENMLVLARLDSLESLEEVDFGPILPGHVIGRVLERHRNRYPSRRLSLQIVDSPPVVLGVEGWITQVVENLLSNAEKYSERSGEIELGVERREEEVCIRVRDSGQGMSEEDAARLFEPFFRMPGSEGLAPGAGLGLSVCRRLVELQGGRIWAKPREEGGMEFAFTLPVVALEEEPE